MAPDRIPMLDDHRKYDAELYQGRSSKPADARVDLGIEWKTCGSFSKAVAVRA